MIKYQAATAAKTKVPVLLTSLLQCPILVSMLNPQESILVITANSAIFGQPELRACLVDAGLVDSKAATRFVLKGCEHLPGFADPNTPIDLSAAQSGLCQLVKAAAAEMAAAGKPVGGVILESAMLPVFSDVLRDQLKYPIFDNLTLSDFAHKALTDNPRFGISFGPKTEPTKNLDPSKLPAIGILRIDYTYPPALGDTAHPNSYYYRTPHATSTGLTFEHAQSGAPLSASQKSAMKAAIAELENKGVMGVSGDCGFLINYQPDVRSMSRVPVFTSSLLQASMVAAMYAPHEFILVLTANGTSLKPSMLKLLAACGVTTAAAQKRFIVVGCEDVPGFGIEVAEGKAVKVDVAQPHIVKLCQAEIKKMPTIRAILLECTELPPYADAIRLATGMPVLDSITIVDFFHSAISENPHLGIDWAKLASTPSFG